MATNSHCAGKLGRLLIRVVATSAIAPGFCVATSSNCSAQTQPGFRTIITYNGSVCVATPTYDLMPDGRVVFKRQGMRFDGSGYFWSTAVRDSVVRRNYYATRIVGTPAQHWPPLAPAPAASRVARRDSLTLQPNSNPYFGSGQQFPTRTSNPQSRREVIGTRSRMQLVRCPNGSYAVTCRYE